MKKYLFPLLIALALVGTACQAATETVEPYAAETTAAEVAVPTSTTEAAAAPVAGEGDFPTSGVMPGCTAVSLSGKPDPQVEELFGPITENDWIFGKADAAVTIIEYSDFQCPYCRLLSIVLGQLKADYPDDLRVVYRQFPLASIHSNAFLAAQAAEAAGAQGQFWEMHDLLYETQDEWSAFDSTTFQQWLGGQASELGLDINQFTTDMLSEETGALVQAAADKGASIGIPGTPFLLINGQVYQGPTDYTNMVLIMKLLTLEKRQYKECPPVVINAAKQYIATLTTEKGDIVIELLPELAPIAVNNFVFLAREGWFDGVTFHRVLAGFMAQTGDPSGTGFGGPGYTFVNEASEIKFDSAGVVAMANSGADSNGSQFFITLASTPHLDGGYTIFGRVLSGQDVVNSITLRDPASTTTLPPGDAVLSVVIEEK